MFHHRQSDGREFVRQRLVARAISLLAALALVLTAGLPFNVIAAAPRIDLSTASGAPGTTVRASGSNFWRGESGSLSWDGVAKGMPAYIADGSGRFKVTFTVPSAAISGTHMVGAVKSQKLRASTSFSVVAGAAATPLPSPTATPTVEPTPTVQPSLAPTAGPATFNRRPYSESSIWNTPVRSNAAVDVNSAAMVATIAASDNGKLRSDPRQYTYPVYFVTNETAKRTITTSQVSRRYNADGSFTGGLYSFDIPIPEGAQPSSGTDRQMIIVNVDTGDEWDIFRFEYYAPNQATRISHYVSGVLRDGQPLNYASRGAGVPYLAGLIRPWEIQAGEIKHALAFAYAMPRQARCVYPAVKTDGNSANLLAIPEGARVQLDPNLDVNSIPGLSSASGKVIARALQVYGAFVVDVSGSNKLYAEDNVTADWGTSLVATTVEAIPVSALRVLQLPAGYYATNYSPNHGGCVK